MKSDNYKKGLHPIRIFGVLAAT